MTDAAGYGPPVWAVYEDVEGLLRQWALAYPERLCLWQAGTSREGRAIWAVAITDPSVPPEDKQHALLSGLHSGVERSATQAILAIMEWLLAGDDAAARETLRRQVVLCVPVAHPDGYVKGEHGMLYVDWTADGPRDPAALPEGVAFQKLVDEFVPDIHADVHGINLGFAACTMLENSAASYSNLALRPYHREIIDWMDQAALEEDFCSDTQESDSELVYWGPEMGGEFAQRAWRGRPRTYGALYGYWQYHTMVLASEIRWAQSGVARHRRLFQVGNETWPGENVAGYPTRVVLTNDYHMVVARGETAAARRASRVELWNRRESMAVGMPDPSVEGKAVFACATTPRAARQWLREGPLAECAERFTALPGADGTALRDFFAGWPGSQNRPEAYLSVRGPEPGAPEVAAPTHGLALRLRLFASSATVQELRLNGRLVELSDPRVGIWQARGMTYVELAVPEGGGRDDEFLLLTCAFDPGARPAEWSVVDALQRAGNAAGSTAR